MKFINIVAEGSCEEFFAKEVLGKHFASMGKFVSVRRIETGWDRINNKPAKGGLLKYVKLRNDVLRWIQSDKGRENTWYSTFVDLYGFPTDSQSPYTSQIQRIVNPYQKIAELEKEISLNINQPNFIPYVQLHEFEAFLLVDPDKLLVMYPDEDTNIKQTKTKYCGHAARRNQRISTNSSI
ncbi:MAG: DUF4276 family protein [Saprospiraceae bacterium]|nr:DUF4276 family protein [Saprospiraceae bacterium]